MSLENLRSDEEEVKSALQSRKEPLENKLYKLGCLVQPSIIIAGGYLGFYYSNGNAGYAILGSLGATAVIGIAKDLSGEGDDIGDPY